jgi:hypothetical protein
MWALLVPVIILEAVLSRRILQVDWRHSFKLSALANAASTLAGIPLTWALLVVLEAFAGSVVGAFEPRSPWWGVILFPFFAPWIAPPGPSPKGLVPVMLAAATLCIPFFFASRWIEYRIGIWLFGESLTTQIWTWSKRANLWSYGLISAGLLAAAGFIALVY